MEPSTTTKRRRPMEGRYTTARKCEPSHPIHLLSSHRSRLHWRLPYPPCKTTRHPKHHTRHDCMRMRSTNANRRTCRVRMSQIPYTCQGFTRSRSARTLALLHAIGLFHCSFASSKRPGPARSQGPHGSPDSHPPSPHADASGHTDPARKLGPTDPHKLEKLLYSLVPYL
jgi:hypothetical protein